MKNEEYPHICTDECDPGNCETQHGIEFGSCMHSAVSWHGLNFNRGECQDCGAYVSPAVVNTDINAVFGYDDYDANSADNQPEVVSRFMVVLVGMTGFLVKADIVISARDQEHAEALAGGIAVACGGATVDAVYELG